LVLFINLENFWIIGDIHGESGLLGRLLDQIEKYRPDRIIFLGDYIDRGPNSREVVDRIRRLGSRTVCLMGNHEAMMLDAIDNAGYVHNPIELWYYNGGEATLHSFGFSSFFSFQADMQLEYLDFFRDLKMNHIVREVKGLNILVTHAGVSPAIPLQEQLGMENRAELDRWILERQLDPGDSFLWIREGFFRSSPELWEGYLVVHGHTPVPKLKRFIPVTAKKEFLFVDNDFCIRRDPQNGRIHSVDIDSGSVITGRLSGLGFFTENSDPHNPRVRMKGLTVSGEGIFPRDLGLVPGCSGG
jgi:serine/threonine protein phosphatase 1